MSQSVSEVTPEMIEAGARVFIDGPLDRHRDLLGALMPRIYLAMQAASPVADEHKALIERLRHLERNGAPTCENGAVCYGWPGDELFGEAADAIEATRTPSPVARNAGLSDDAVVERVAAAMKQTVSGMVDRWTKDDFDGWVERCCTTLARAALTAATPSDIATLRAENARLTRLNAELTSLDSALGAEIEKALGPTADGMTGAWPHRIATLRARLERVEPALRNAIYALEYWHREAKWAGKEPEWAKGPDCRAKEAVRDAYAALSNTEKR